MGRVGAQSGRQPAVCVSLRGRRPKACAVLPRFPLRQEHHSMNSLPIDDRNLPPDDGVPVKKGLESDGAARVKRGAGRPPRIRPPQTLHPKHDFDRITRFPVYIKAADKDVICVEFRFDYSSSILDGTYWGKARIMNGSTLHCTWDPLDKQKPISKQVPDYLELLHQLEAPRLIATRWLKKGYT